MRVWRKKGKDREIREGRCEEEVVRRFFRAFLFSLWKKERKLWPRQSPKSPHISGVKIFKNIKHWLLFWKRLQRWGVMDDDDDDEDGGNFSLVAAEGYLWQHLLFLTLSPQQNFWFWGLWGGFGWRTFEDTSLSLSSLSPWFLFCFSFFLSSHTNLGPAGPLQRGVDSFFDFDGFCAVSTVFSSFLNSWPLLHGKDWVFLAF